MTPSDYFYKYMSYRLDRFVPDFVYHQYGICRMYSEENP